MFISPYEIFNKNDEDKFAIIVDCKNTETPSRNMSLDQQLGLLTLASAQKQGFSNIVLFEDREDFDIAVSELTEAVELFIGLPAVAPG